MFYIILIVFMFCICIVLPKLLSSKNGIFHNKYGVRFTNLKFPDDKDFIVIRYINGPLKDFYSFGLFIKEDNKFVIKIENREKEVSEFDILFEDILGVTIEKKPYVESVSKTFDYGGVIGAALDGEHVGSFTGEYETTSGISVIPSYEIVISLEDESKIIITSLDKPSFLQN